MGEGAVLNNLGKVYCRIGEPQRAMTCYEQALSIMKEVGDQAGEAAVLHNLGTIYSSIGQLDKARQLFEQALQIQREVSNRAGEAAILGNLATIYLKKDNQNMQSIYSTSQFRRTKKLDMYLRRPPTSSSWQYL